ncbi:hypothetical protein G5I_01846 [Acromyrmex echinatior]|uniref:Uncharacterized protein n=1 Tax=Acromyrmex echinatior TaxID=103372 RepID=F4W8R4_ACREC|nr:hypothetical protein G5I_01846 [Acromyrmex echinatior]
MKIDADAGASRERSQARDTKYRRNGRVARIPRINVFPVSAASVEVRSGRIPGDAARGCPTYIAQKRSASPRLEIYPSTCPSKSCGVVDLADGTRRRRHAERSLVVVTTKSKPNLSQRYDYQLMAKVLSTSTGSSLANDWLLNDGQSFYRSVLSPSHHPVLISTANTALVSELWW